MNAMKTDNFLVPFLMSMLTAAATAPHAFAQAGLLRSESHL